MLAVFYHEDCQKHEMGQHHPESPLRLEAVQKAIKDIKADTKLELIKAEAGKQELLLQNHSESYVEQVFASAPKGKDRISLDGDTSMNSHSLQASLLAVGATTAAVDWAMQATGNRAFCAIRPPGHHAEPMHAMGFCIFNNIAIAAKYAQNTYDCRRIAVIDFDVHHGNGTQSAFYESEDLFFASTHQFPYYPGSGDRTEKGKYNNIVNVPLQAGNSNAEFAKAYDDVIFPALRKFKPDLIMISAGFDGHKHDPLASLNLESVDYFHITQKIAEIAEEFCNGRLVSVLEGGYDLQALYESSGYHLKALSNV